MALEDRQDTQELQDQDQSPWRRRMSHPLPIPTFRPNIPNIPHLRAALLGYLGELEAALRRKLGDDLSEIGEVLHGGGSGRGRGRLPSISLSSSISAEDWTTSTDSNDEDPYHGYSSALAGPSSTSEFRQRNTATNANRCGSPSTNTNANDNTTTGSSSTKDSYVNLLNHLSALREEASNYLPSLSVHMPLSIPNREWLRALPSRLSIVDPGLLSPLDKAKIKDELAAVIDFESGAVEGARKRVVDMVHAMLPSEDWAGWERLGWEEQEYGDGWRPGEYGHRRTRSVSLGRSGKGKHNQDNDSDYPDMEMMEDEEPEYLFPNRTPASTRALARRRAVRSKSVGAAPLPSVKRAKVERSQSYAFGSLISFSPGKAVSEPAEMESGGGSDREDGDEAEDEDGDEVDRVMNGERKDVEEFTSISYLSVDLKSSLIAVGTTTDPSVADGLRSSEDGRKLITYDELPAIWRNNEHIHTGYRFIPLHLKTGPVPLIKSAFAMHNETVNIHSHLIPTLFIFACIPFIMYNTPLPDAHPLDTAVVIAYLVAAISCLSSSAGWHVLSGCASRKWFEWGACVDYIGISWLIAASFGTVVYNGFYCQPKLTLFYCTTNMLCGALGSYLPFQRWFNERRNKHLRISFFLFLCFAMFAPMVHMFGQYGWHKASAFVAPFMVSIVAYVIGLLFYAFHFPECKWPGKFDIWGSSHQLWHLGIVVAIVLHYRAIFVAHGVKHEYSCAAPGQEISVAMVLERMIGWR
ncbi:hemolysin [Cryptococcus neoformans Bt85]|nr:hemolysin [Cryptococcus neoformans var. grubii Bt85]